MSDGKAITESAVAEPTQQMMQILGGLWVARLVSVAAELGIADVIGDGRKTTEELAAATKTHAPSLYRVLRGLAGANIFREDGQGAWTNTTLSKVLRSNDPSGADAWRGTFGPGSAEPAAGRWIGRVTDR